MKNKIFISVLSVALISVFSLSSVSAAELNKFYEEHQQINFKDFQISLDSQNNIVSNNKTKNLSNDEKIFNQYIDENSEFENYMINYLKQGRKPEAIGVTTLYLKDIELEDGTKTSVPMTKADMARYGGTGSPSYGPQNKFKLYTVADYEMGQLHGSSFVQYLGNNNSTRQYNYIGVTLPSQFTMTSNNLSHSSSYHYRQDEENNAVVWAVAMNPSPSVAPLKSIALYSKGKSSSTVSQKKVISHFVHNYSGINLGISLSASGASLSISGSSKYWKVSSSVTI